MSSSKEQPKTLLLCCGASTRQISSSAFYEVSEPLRRSPPADGRLQLDEYDPRAVLSFLPQYLESRHLSEKVSCTQLRDLFRLGCRFQLAQMLDILEVELLSLAKKSGDFLIQALIIGETVILTAGRKGQLVALAAANFLSLAENPEFRLIPPVMMSLILQDCHLAVENELQLVDAVLLWLSRQYLVDALAPLVFNSIRTAALDSASYFRIVQRMTDLNFTEKARRYISLLLTSTNGARVCWHDHSADNSRCHGLDPISSEETMPLSRPDDRKWIKQSKQQCLYS